MFVIPVLTDVAFKMLSAGWHLVRNQVCARSFSPNLLFLCRCVKSTASVSASRSAVARCHPKALTVQPRQPLLDPRPATHLPHRYMYSNGNQRYDSLGFRDYVIVWLFIVKKSYENTKTNNTLITLIVIVC